MAKPIPINRRWQENQRIATQNSASRSAAPQPSAPRARQTLREALAEMFRALQLEPAVEQIVPVRENPPRVIQARYAQTCSGCGLPIRPGHSITRHPRWGEWVHVGCRDREQRAAHPAIVARYDGLCHLCLRPIQQGQLISRVNRSWVHQQCALHAHR